jgi:hypothetical protein
MPFPQISNLKESAISSYNEVDIAAGTGLTNFYAGDVASGSILSNQAFYADTVVAGFYSATPGGSYAKVLDLDFDVLINKPLTIGGKVVINVPIYNTNVGGGGGQYLYVIAKVRKWNGTTETEIASNQSRTSISGAGGASVYDMFAIDLDIPETEYKWGEYLRLTTEAWALCTVASTVSIAADPMNRTTGWDATGAVPSRLVFQVPRRIDL